MDNKFYNKYNKEIVPLNLNPDTIDNTYNKLLSSKEIFEPVASINKYDNNPYYYHTTVLLNEGLNLLYYQRISDLYMGDYLCRLYNLYTDKIIHFINMIISNNISKYLDISNPDIQDKLYLLYFNKFTDKFKSLSNYIHNIYDPSYNYKYYNMSKDYSNNNSFEFKVELSKYITYKISNFSNSLIYTTKYDYYTNQSTLLFENIFLEIMETISAIVSEFSYLFKGLFELLSHLIIHEIK